VYFACVCACHIFSSNIVRKTFFLLFLYTSFGIPLKCASIFVRVQQVFLSCPRTFFSFSFRAYKSRAPSLRYICRVIFARHAIPDLSLELTSEVKWNTNVNFCVCPSKTAHTTSAHLKCTIFSSRVLCSIQIFLSFFSFQSERFFLFFGTFNFLNTRLNT
jgi:hypothetical protein